VAHAVYQRKDGAARQPGAGDGRPGLRADLQRVATGTLNDIINEPITITEPPSDKGRRLKIFYATQVAVKPPTFVLKVNDPALMHFSYQRYLENYLRKSFALTGTPLRMYIRPRGGEGS
jgi:GTP-binding protein